MTGCIGYTDSTMTMPCPDPVTGEVRIVNRNGGKSPWRPVCTVHGDATMSILSIPGTGYTAERRPAGNEG